MASKRQNSNGSLIFATATARVLYFLAKLLSKAQQNDKERETSYQN